MKSLLKFIFLIFFFGILDLYAQEKQNDHLMMGESKYDFKKTISRLEKLLKQDEVFSINAKIDHSKYAEKAKLNLPQASVLMFENARLGTMLMQKDQLAGLELPFKILVYDKENKTIVAYNSINYLRSRYDFKRVKNLTGIKKELKNMAAKATGGKIEKTGKFNLDMHEGIISEISDFDFNTTYDRLLSIIKNDPDLDIFAEIDHFRNAQKVGLGLRPTRLIIFGYPKTGTSIMQEKTKIALEFPTKFLIWRDEAGVVKISYNDPAFLAKRFKLNKNNPQLQNLKVSLENLSKIAAKY
ncbi:uncharacterized protein (DUF302 family) [Salegentibacter sp. 24]|jgi:uncharacterized protein (DUF302 family)|uniref:DUF302 domain-containing protein n=1 Tax=Salegentibacter sp. 24 TaxID=2183986 RepID=UPI00105C046D|nr:DUF302 domain-containing protein [Salegentibacter sp. 24]TDN90466.1 uncharacterized protein (DUF302 family) [Salegentibacter sp. 24]